MSNTVSSNIDQVERLFMQVAEKVHGLSGHEEVCRYLDTMEGRYVSIAYESASMELAYADLVQGKKPERWLRLYEEAAASHPFHLQIGLGWAFGRAGLQPAGTDESYPKAWIPLLYDGIGYYHALYKGRSTIKQQARPESVGISQHAWFDQGVGRRLWYHSRGDLGVLQELLGRFSQERAGALWKGIGVACGYVGGTNPSMLQELAVLSGPWLQDLGSGIKLAAISRVLSASADDEIRTACKVIGGPEGEDWLDRLSEDEEVLQSIYNR